MTVNSYEFQKLEYERIMDNADSDSVSFYKKAQKSIAALNDLVNHWESNPGKYNDNFTEGYPFGNSLDEVVAQGFEWLANIIKRMDIQNKKYEPTITVGEFKKVLNQLPDDYQITVYNNNLGWLNITSVDFPDDEKLVTVVLNANNQFSIFQV